MRKVFFGLALWGILPVLLLANPFASVAAAQDGQANGAQNGTFNLEPLDGDAPDILQYKAALRIFGGVQAVYQITSRCGGNKSWTGYEKRNGNTLARVVKKFELGGGFGVPQKTAVDAYAEGQVKEALSSKNCQGLLRDIDSQEWDIYKGARFSEDYTLIKGK
ncbi:MAG: hypothetical protein LBR53_11360 [Deltaproteobacteria bacterium]|nr:hypothetical protein [Deltaproteobacteria bacterium]